MKAGLYVVPTPIGNIDDMTLRGIQVLRDVDVIAAEDTRHSRPLLLHFNISTPLLSFHEHSRSGVAEEIADRIGDGEAVALISDAGTPLVSDPGYVLVRAVQGRGFPVIPLPGACAAITALSAAGLPTSQFQFEGFLPAKRGARLARLESLKALSTTLIVYEAPHRILDLLSDMADVMGSDREVCIARELTKTFETIRRASLGDTLDWVSNDANQRRGELVVLLGPCLSSPGVIDSEVISLLTRLGAELPPRKASQIVGEHFGIKSRALYQLLISQE